MIGYDSWRLDSPEGKEFFEETITIVCEDEKILSEFMDKVEELKKEYGIE